MLNRCPGQDDRNIQAESIRCPDCGYTAEIFTDENKVRCPECSIFIYKAKLPSCAAWCKSAGYCI